MSKEFNLSPELIEKLDKIYPNPEQLATEFYNECVLGKTLSAHTILAFCINFLALQVQEEYNFLEHPVREVGRLFYTSHYYSLWEKHIKDGKTSLLETADESRAAAGNGEISQGSIIIPSES